MSIATASTKLDVEEEPRIVCLCGSTRFANEFMQASFQETVAGNIVLTVGGFSVNAHGNWQPLIVTDEQKVSLDKLHLRKIDIADEVLVINVGGYIGESTLNEIKHALSENKPIRFLEPIIAPGNLSADVYELLNNVLHTYNGCANVISLTSDIEPVDSGLQQDFGVDLVIDPINPGTGVPTGVTDPSADNLEIFVRFEIGTPMSTLILDKSLAIEGLVTLFAEMFNAAVFYKEAEEEDWQFYQVVSSAPITNNKLRQHPRLIDTVVASISEREN